MSVPDDSAGFTGDIPTNYDRHLGPVLFSGYAAEMASYAAAYSPQVVLETAAGTGRVTRALRDALPQATLIATDLNESMLALAAQRFTSDDDVRLEPADAQQLPYDDASADIVVCQFGVMFYPDLRRSFAEARRVLRPGGGYLFSVWGGLADNPYARITEELLRELYPHDTPPFYRVPFAMGDPAPLAAAAQAAGFTAHRVEALPRERDVASWHGLATGALLGSPVADQIAARPGPSAEELVGTLAERFEAELGPAPGRLPMLAFFHTATV